MGSGVRAFGPRYLIPDAATAKRMAKHTGKGKRRYNLRRIRVTDEQALGTLASDIAILGGLHGAVVAAIRVVSAAMTWALNGLTEGEGPITVGYAHGDYTVTEIKECLEAQASASGQDKIARERANRLIRVVGTFSGEANQSLNDGKPIKTRLNWRITPGVVLNAFVFNEGTGALTTGAFIHTQGNLWVKDSV